MYKDEKLWDRIATNFDRIEQNDIPYKFFLKINNWNNEH
jgi:hypothetical protein